MISTCMDDNLLWRHQADQPASVAQLDGCLIRKEQVRSPMDLSTLFLWRSIMKYFLQSFLGAIPYIFCLGQHTEGLARELIE